MKREGVGRFDTALHMFVLPPAALNRRRVGFLRWLAERGELEHRVEGAPSGPLTDDDATDGKLWPWSAFADEEPPA